MIDLELTAEDDEAIVASARARWLASGLTVLFLAAQLIFAFHVGDGGDNLADHSRADCPVCMAGAMAPDPVDLVVSLDAPKLTFELAEFLWKSAARHGGESARANSRGPPLN